MRYNRGMGNALVRRVRRHATTMTLFRAAAPASGRRFVRPESVPQPVTGVVQATLVPASASLPLGRVIGVPFIERAAGPAVGTPAQQAPIPPTPPAPVPFTQPPSFASPKISSDDDWRRLQTIFRKHQEKQTAQERPVEGLTAPPEGSPVLPQTEPPSLQREPTPPQQRGPETRPRLPQPDERRRPRVEYVSPPAEDVTPRPAPTPVTREPQAITAPDIPTVQAQAEPPPRPAATMQQEVARPVHAEAEPQPTLPVAPKARVSREASTVITPIQASPGVAPPPQQPAESLEPDRPGVVPEPAPTARIPESEPVEQLPPEALPDRRVARRAADLAAERAEAPTVIRKAPTTQLARTPPTPSPAERAPSEHGEPPAPAGPSLEEAVPDTAVVEEISPGDDTIALPYVEVQEQIPAPGFPTQPRPLEAAWPVQRREEPTLAFIPPAASLSTAETLPSWTVDEQEIHRFLGDVVAAQPTDSSIEVITPRRPRPVPPPTAVPRTPVPPAGVTPSPPAVQMRREAEPEPAGIQTEIGPLPADLWQLLDQSPPGQPPMDTGRPHLIPQATEAGDTAKAQPLSPVSTPRPAGPTLVSPIVQREAAPPPPASEPEAGGAEARIEETTPTGEVDTDELARQVYAEIKRRLAVEWERVRQRF